MTYEEAVALLPDRDKIHTNVEAGMGVMGANWDRTDILEYLRTADQLLATHGMAKAMGHGLLAVSPEGRRLFIETVDTDD